MYRYREEVTNLLTQQFSTEGPADGDEYAKALDTQVNAECYVVAIAALLADRRETMNAKRTTLASHEYKDAAKRKTMRFELRILLSQDAFHSSTIEHSMQRLMLHFQRTIPSKFLCNRNSPISERRSSMDIYRSP